VAGFPCQNRAVFGKRTCPYFSLFGDCGRLCVSQRISQRFLPVFFQNSVVLFPPLANSKPARAWINNNSVFQPASGRRQRMGAYLRQRLSEYFYFHAVLCTEYKKFSRINLPRNTRNNTKEEKKNAKNLAFIIYK
jgi:hypothetical protein